jgi:hypothetical protein
MPSVNVSQIIELVNNDGYDASFEAYDSIVPVYNRLGMIVNPRDAGMPLRGDKGTVYTAHERFREREDGQQVEKSTIDKAYTWQAAIKQFSRGMTIDSRTIQAGDMGSIKASVIQFAQDRGETAILDKEDYIADMFQQGTLTAGDTAHFDNAYPGEADASRGFIYDGLPWYDGAHTSISGSTYSNIATTRTLTHANLITSTTAMRTTNAVNDRGDRVRVNPNTVLVPAGLEHTARVLIASGQLPGSANNDVNTLQGAYEVIGWSALADAASSAAWWLLQLGKGLRIYDSGAPRYWVVQEDNGDVTVNSEYYFGAAVDNWRYGFANNKVDA